MKFGTEKGIEKGIILSIKKMRIANLTSEEIIKILDLDKNMINVDEIRLALYD